MTHMSLIFWEKKFQIKIHFLEVNLGFTIYFMVESIFSRGFSSTFSTNIFP